MNGLLITFEGIDGSGKSTQARLFHEFCLDRDFTAHLLREPGGTAIGEHVRTILLDVDHRDMTARTELFLFLAARTQLTAERIMPAFERGDIVIVDRFIDSTTAYQGFGRDLGYETTVGLNRMATGGMLPDKTILVDCDPATALSRAGAEPDRMESEGSAFMEKVREGFLACAEMEPSRIHVVDGRRSVDAVRGEIEGVLRPLLAALSAQR